MKRLKIQLIIMIVSFVFFIGMIGLLILMRDADRQTEETTLFCHATVLGVEINDTGKAVSVEIFTDEYDNSLHISTNITKNICMDNVKNLKKGQSIFFGIEKTNAAYMNEAAFVSITSLRTDTKVIFSLEEYNQYMHNSLYPTRIAGAVVAALLLCLSIFCFLKIRRNRKNETNSTD